MRDALMVSWMSRQSEEFLCFITYCWSARATNSHVCVGLVHEQGFRTGFLDCDSALLWDNNRGDLSAMST